MKTAQPDPTIEQYLTGLRHAARQLPRRDRDELVADIEAHIASGMDQSDRSESSIRNLLDQLGAPEDIVAAAQPTGPIRALGARETWAILLLLVGGLIIPIAGWLIGVVLLWSSPAWPASKKWLATLIWPTGLAAPLIGAALVVASSSGNSWTGLVIIVVAVIAPLLVAYHLLHTARPVADT